MTFLDEMYGIGTLTDPHLDEYDGADYVTPSLIDHDDGKETRSIGNHENPQPDAGRRTGQPRRREPGDHRR